MAEFANHLQYLPYGWTEENQRLQPVPHEQWVIRYIRKLAAFGHDAPSIAKILRHDKISFRPPLVWSALDVEHILTNGDRDLWQDWLFQEEEGL